MQFTDAVEVSGQPPVAADDLRICKRLLSEFALAHAIPQPVNIEWTEHEGVIHFIGQHDGRLFGIGAPKAN